MRPALFGLHYIHAVNGFVNLRQLKPVIAASGLMRDKSAQIVEWTAATLLRTAVRRGYVMRLASSERDYHVVGNEYLEGFLRDVNADLLDTAVATGRFGDDEEQAYIDAHSVAMNVYHEALQHRRDKVFPGTEVVHTNEYAAYAGSLGLLAVLQTKAPLYLG